VPETTQVEYGLRELTELMVRDRGLTEGNWQLIVRFSFAAATIDALGQGPAPSVISRVESVGLSRVDEPNPFSIQASAVNFPTPKTARRGTKK
jgi:hypothetical protein